MEEELIDKQCRIAVKDFLKYNEKEIKLHTLYKVLNKTLCVAIVDHR